MEGARNERCHKWAHKYLKALKTYTKHTQSEGEKKDREREREGETARRMPQSNV